jgi:5-(carboxyamino)imidazole ribonucleotide synthase
MTIGIVGGGQLGRMMILAGRNMGYRFVILDPDPHCPAATVADRHICSPYDQRASLDQLGDESDIITYEFEGLPIDSIHYLESRQKVRPNSCILEICQNRYKEKNFLKTNGIACAPFEIISSARELKSALQILGAPAVMKTAYWGYDGKGQIKLEHPDIDCEKVWSEMQTPLAIVEKWISYERECSVLIARTPDGASSTFPVVENEHCRHILDRSILPARLPESTQEKAREISAEIAELLQLEGLMAVEFFVTLTGDLLVNEMAPRPHNSGHCTMDACWTSQFEQSIRAICNMPLGPTSLKHPVVMVNLMGEHWVDGESPAWKSLLANPHYKLHLYDKKSAPEGRKMGHINCLAQDQSEALAASMLLKNTLENPHCSGTE